MNITEALVLEHRVFATVFNQIERAVPGMNTISEVRRLAGIVEALLAEHGATETNLAYLALDHVMHDRGRLDRLHQDHREIDERLQQIESAGTCDEARRLFAAALQATREHMEFEEQNVFPLLEQVVDPATLAELGEIRFRRSSPEPVAP